jgi:hypothetical protein
MVMRGCSTQRHGRSRVEITFDRVLPGLALFRSQRDSLVAFSRICWSQCTAARVPMSIVHGHAGARKVHWLIQNR